MVNHYAIEKQIFVIENQKSWREFSSKTLKAAGYQVKVFGDYDKFDIAQAIKPDLVIVGFARVTQAEIELIKKIHRHRLYQLALSTFLSWREMRILFLAGADDVAEKSFSSQGLLKTVLESFNNISIKKRNKLNEYESL